MARGDFRPVRPTHDARRAFHETGEIPAHLLAEPLRASWRRSACTGVDSRARIEFDPVTRGDLRTIGDRSEALLRAGDDVVDGLLGAVAGTPWLLLLLDAGGVIARALNDSPRLSDELRRIARVGVDLSEPRIGTNGPGTALVEGAPVLVVGDQHFVEANAIYTCAAAPIRNPQGEIVGCLDLSCRHDNTQWKFDPLELVTSCSRLIENRMFAQLTGHMVIRLAAHEGLFGPCTEAVLALDACGRVVAANHAAASLFGMSGERLRTCRALTLFDLPTMDHLQYIATDASARLRLCNGLNVIARIHDPTRTRPHTRPHAQADEAPPRRDAASTQDFDLDQLAGGHAVFAAEAARARLAFAHDIPVMLQGETGTGKELLARALHASSSRRHAPFVAINCAALPETLIETELFGYADGAYTGARRGGAPGKIELAHRGTLFLDEIGDMPLALQTRLLRVLEQRMVNRVGGRQDTPVDIAVISASHRRLRDMVHAGTFREDLFYRIDGTTVELPPLREREDFEALARRILDRVAVSRPAPRVSPAAMKLLTAYAWPGNLRELTAVLRAAAVFAEGGCIAPDHLPAHVRAADTRAEKSSAQYAPGSIAGDESAVSAPRPLEQLELEAMHQAVAAHGGNMAAAARTLRISRGTLYRKLKAHTR